MLLCLTGAHVEGGLGINSEVERVPGGMVYKEDATNQYGFLLGDISFKAKFNRDFFIKLNHTSGINTAESDWGLNYFAMGVKTNVHRFMGSIAYAHQIGPQTSNMIGNNIIEFEVQYKWSNGIYISRKILYGFNGSSYSSFVVGMTAEF